MVTAPTSPPSRPARTIRARSGASAACDITPGRASCPTMPEPILMTALSLLPSRACSETPPLRWAGSGAVALVGQPLARERLPHLVDVEAQLARPQPGAV